MEYTESMNYFERIRAFESVVYGIEIKWVSLLTIEATKGKEWELLLELDRCCALQLTKNGVAAAIEERKALPEIKNGKAINKRDNVAILTLSGIGLGGRKGAGYALAELMCRRGIDIFALFSADGGVSIAIPAEEAETAAKLLIPMI